MTLAELRVELAARGFEHLTTTLQNNMLNRAYAEVNDQQPWPYLETTATGTAPLTITDFGHALSVIDTTQKGILGYDDSRNIYELDPTQAQTGNPNRWYWTGTQVAVWPLNTTNTLSVRYIKTPTALSADSDTPILPARFHYVLVDGAVCYAHERAGEYNAECAARFGAGIEKMTYALLVPNYDTPDDIVLSGSTDW